MNDLRAIPELAALRAARHVVRIPPEIDVPLTARVRRLIDTAPFRRLARISQLGLVSLVYPAANHTRHEHSLGVYRMALLFLDRLVEEPRFAAAVSRDAAEAFILAALLHDVGHWPFCHPIEDMSLPGLPRHEGFAAGFILEGEIAAALEQDWGIDPPSVVELLAGKSTDPSRQLLRSMLSGPIDVDKMDYLMRDSLHAGVPYGRNFDQARLIQSLCLNEAGDRLAISDKGKTAAEMMVFARYVMFSEVYWHHAVRAATAMFQRAFHLLPQSVDVESLFRMAEEPMIAALQGVADDRPAGELLSGMFGPKRQLYKRVFECSLFQHAELHERLARRPYPSLVQCGERLAATVSRRLGVPVEPHELLIDAPPVKLEVEFQIDVYYSKDKVYRRLGDVSPVVQTLAKQQFDDYVKRVRVFAHPRIADALRADAEFGKVIAEALDAAEP